MPWIRPLNPSTLRSTSLRRRPVLTPAGGGGARPWASSGAGDLPCGDPALSELSMSTSLFRRPVLTPAAGGTARAVASDDAAGLLGGGAAVGIAARALWSPEKDFDLCRPGKGTRRLSDIKTDGTLQHDCSSGMTADLVFV